MRLLDMRNWLPLSLLALSLASATAQAQDRSGDYAIVCTEGSEVPLTFAYSAAWEQRVVLFEIGESSVREVVSVSSLDGADAASLPRSMAECFVLLPLHASSPTSIEASILELRSPRVLWSEDGGGGAYDDTRIELRSEASLYIGVRGLPASLVRAIRDGRPLVVIAEELAREWRAGRPGLPPSSTRPESG